MRIVKEARERKNEILDAAARLFNEKGFDNTSTNDILEAVGIARGTLYHHFKSKEAIMDVLIERQTSYLLEEAKQAAGDKSLSLEERFFRTAMALHVDENAVGTNNREMLGHLHKPQNALMHQKTQKIIMEQVPLILAEILEDGISQGIIDTPYPLECMEMVLAYLDTVFDGHNSQMSEEKYATRVKAFIFHLERMLGAEEGTFSFVNKMLQHKGEQSNEE